MSTRNLNQQPQINPSRMTASRERINNCSKPYVAKLVVADSTERKVIILPPAPLCTLIVNSGEGINNDHFFLPDLLKRRYLSASLVGDDGTERELIKSEPAKRGVVDPLWGAEIEFTREPGNSTEYFMKELRADHSLVPDLQMEPDKLFAIKETDILVVKIEGFRSANLGQAEIPIEELIFGSACGYRVSHPLMFPSGENTGGHIIISYNFANLLKNNSGEGNSSASSIIKKMKNMAKKLKGPGKFLAKVAVGFICCGNNCDSCC